MLKEYINKVKECRPKATWKKLAFGFTTFLVLRSLYRRHKK